MQTFRGTRTRMSRRIAADPTSTALLLAGPTAVELWPGARRVGELDGRMVVETSLPSGLPSGPSSGPALSSVPTGEQPPAVVTVRALPPRRTPTAYVTRFEWSGRSLPPASARLTLAYAPTAESSPVTHAVLELDLASVGDAGPYGGRALTLMAEGFLQNLARAAEMRNRAA